MSDSNKIYLLMISFHLKDNKKKVYKRIQTLEMNVSAKNKNETDIAWLPFVAYVAYLPHNYTLVQPFCP